MTDGTGDTAYEQRRRAMLEQLYAMRHELAQELVEHYRDAIEEYRDLPEQVLHRDVADVAVQNIENLVGAFEDGFDDAGGGHGWLRRGAARRVHQHVSLPALLRTFRLWGTHVWQTMARLAGDDDVARRLSVDAADAMMTYVDRISVAVTKAYIHESSAIGADSRALRADVLETLLTGEPASEPARRQCAVLGMTLRQRLLVLVIQLPPRSDPYTGAQSAVRIAQNTLSPLVTSVLVGVRDTEVVSICVLSADDDDREVATAADRFVKPGQWTVGVGRVAEGLAGVRRSYAEAREAADLGLSTRAPDRAIRFADVLLDQILRSTRYTEALLEETVRPLADYDTRKQAELLPTLRAYVATNFNLTKAAAELSVNPNTVVYRLRRIQSLTSRDPANVDDLLLLALGLRLFDSAPPL